MQNCTKDPESCLLHYHRQQLKYTSHEVQNELLSIMAQHALRKVAQKIQRAVFFTIMIDETTDCSNKQLVMLMFYWVGEDLSAHKDFVGLYLTNSITSAALNLASIIEDTMLSMSIKLEHCHGQCYDGAIAISGTKPEVASHHPKNHKHAVYMHVLLWPRSCNLTVGDTVKQCSIIKSTLEVV